MNTFYKTCPKCGKLHTEVDKDAQIMEGLIWMNCNCGGTMVAPVGDVYRNVFSIREMRTAKRKEMLNRINKAKKLKRLEEV